MWKPFYKSTEFCKRNISWFSNYIVAYGAFHWILQNYAGIILCKASSFFWKLCWSFNIFNIIIEIKLIRGSSFHFEFVCDGISKGNQSYKVWDPNYTPEPIFYISVPYKVLSALLYPQSGCIHVCILIAQCLPYCRSLKRFTSEWTNK